MLRWSDQNANQKVGPDKMPTTEISPDKMQTFGWHYVRLAFCLVGILSAHHLESTPYLYADDCTLLARGGCIFETNNILNRDLLKITKWALSWKVTFNPSKSKDLIFSNKLLPSHPTIFGLHCIERVTTVKHLGVFLTSTLDWNKQIQSIVKKVNYKLSIIQSVKGLSDNVYMFCINSTLDQA